MGTILLTVVLVLFFMVNPCIPGIFYLKLFFFAIISKQLDRGWLALLLGLIFCIQLFYHFFQSLLVWHDLERQFPGLNRFFPVAALIKTLAKGIEDVKIGPVVGEVFAEK